MAAVASLGYSRSRSSETRGSCRAPVSRDRHALEGDGEGTVRRCVPVGATNLLLLMFNDLVFEDG